LAEAECYFSVCGLWLQDGARPDAQLEAGSLWSGDRDGGRFDGRGIDAVLFPGSDAGKSDLLQNRTQ